MAYIQAIAGNKNDKVAFQFAWLNGVAELAGKHIVLQLGTGNVRIGSFGASLIDMGDISKFPSSIQSPNFGGTQLSTFGHELFEQMYKQAWGTSNFQASHQFALSMESELAGAWRGGDARVGNSLAVTWYSGVRMNVQYIDDFFPSGAVSGVHF